MTSDPMTLMICTHNRGPRIRETLDAVYAMDRAGGRVAELLIVDNASTDDTGAIVDEVIASGPAIPTRRVMEPRIGAIHARRRAIIEAATPLVAWLDDDVIPSPGWAKAILSALDRSDRVGVVGSRISLRWETGPTSLATKFRSQLAEQELGDEASMLSRPESGLATAALAARRQAILDSGWVEHAYLCGPNGSQLSRGEDYEMVIRVRKAGWEAWYEPSARIEHLIPPGRQTREYLINLAHGIGEAKSWLNWIAMDKPGLDWIDSELRRVEKRYRRSKLLEWRPNRRVVRTHDRQGRLDGLRLLREHVVEQSTGGSDQSVRDIASAGKGAG